MGNPGRASEAIRRLEYFLDTDLSAPREDHMTLDELSRRQPRTSHPIDEGEVVATFIYNRRTGEIEFTPAADTSQSPNEDYRGSSTPPTNNLV